MSHPHLYLLQPGVPFLPTYDVLYTSGPVTSENQHPSPYHSASFSPLLGALKPANVRMHTLLAAEGLLPRNLLSAFTDSELVVRVLVNAAAPADGEDGKRVPPKKAQTL
ncbi:hypothetical protein EW145_g4561 [Phellinidium pouzarii]|uniref:Uncharacterized protein n=1 Tax=Phellinidium pouzarii TaxID=167371 RepID=A0A4S4L4X2_9AGAM|nr:hypothetical protein EW145_g4561 [Phellinidium pouzarii]